MPFDDNSFDVIYAGESVLHVKDKTLLFKEFYRVLTPGGEIVLNDWFHASDVYSKEMEEFVHADGITFNLSTIDEYVSDLKNAGFTSIDLLNNSQDTLNETREVVHALSGDLGKKVIAEYDEKYLKEYIDSWEQQAHIFESGQMFTYIVRVSK